MYMKDTENQAQTTKSPKKYTLNRLGFVRSKSLCKPVLTTVIMTACTLCIDVNQNSRIGKFLNKSGLASSAYAGAPVRYTINTIAGDGAYDISLATNTSTTPLRPGDSQFAMAPDVTGTLGAHFANPSAVVVDTHGKIFIADTDNNAIRMITPAGVMSTIGVFYDSAGTGAVPPCYLALDNANNLYVAALGRIVQIPSGSTTYNINSGTAVTLFRNGSTNNALDAAATWAPDATNVINAFSQTGLMQNGDQNYLTIQGIAVDSSNNIYFASSNYPGIFKFTMGTASCTQIFGGPDGNRALYGLTLYETATTRYLYSIDTNNFINQWNSVYANSTWGAWSSPIAFTTSVSGGLTVDASGSLYIADTNNNFVRTIPAASLYTTVNTSVVPTIIAGGGSGGTASNTASGIPATGTSGLYAGLSGPQGICVNTSGTIFITEGNSGSSTTNLLRTLTLPATVALDPAHITTAGVITSPYYGVLTFNGGGTVSFGSANTSFYGAVALSGAGTTVEISDVQALGTGAIPCNHLTMGVGTVLQAGAGLGGVSAPSTLPFSINYSSNATINTADDTSATHGIEIAGAVASTVAGTNTLTVTGGGLYVPGAAYVAAVGANDVMVISGVGTTVELTGNSFSPPDVQIRNGAILKALGGVTLPNITVGGVIITIV